MGRPSGRELDRILAALKASGTWDRTLIVRGPQSMDILEAGALSVSRDCDGRSLSSVCRCKTPADWLEEIYWAFDFSDIRARDVETKLNLPSNWRSLQILRTETLKYVHFAGLPPALFDLATTRTNASTAPSIRLRGRFWSRELSAIDIAKD